MNQVNCITDDVQNQGISSIVDGIVPVLQQAGLYEAGDDETLKQSLSVLLESAEQVEYLGVVQHPDHADIVLNLPSQQFKKAKRALSTPLLRGFQWKKGVTTHDDQSHTFVELIITKSKNPSEETALGSALRAMLDKEKIGTNEEIAALKAEIKEGKEALAKAKEIEDHLLNEIQLRASAIEAFKSQLEESAKNFEQVSSAQKVALERALANKTSTLKCALYTGVGAGVGALAVAAAMHFKKKA